MKPLLSLAFLCISMSVFSLDPAKVTINRVTAPYFIVDGNSPSTITSAYVGFEIINNSNSGVTYSNLIFTITSVSSNVVGQNYTILSPASGISAIGTLAPGASRICYFYVSYPASTIPQATFNVVLSDATFSSKSASFIIRNRSSISANAGGAATQTFTNQDIIGGIITDDVTYTVGNVQNGDEADFQVAVSSAFDPTKVSLLGTRVIASTVPGIAASSTDSLYFITGNGSNGASVTIRWTFRITGYNFTTNVLPCAGATSGNTNYKYALNTSLGGGTPITVSASANPLTISKTSDQAVYLVNSTATFTITISNPGVYDVTIDKITDNIPAGFIYDGIAAISDVNAINSTTVPASGSTGLISFIGGVISGANTSYLVPAGGSIQLVYTATAPANSTTALTTTAKDYVGTTEVGSADNTVQASFVLPVKLLSFKGLRDNKIIRINWQTGEEINTTSFELQKMNSAGVFNSLNVQTANGIASYYSFNDIAPAQGNNYYRLKSIDSDGRFYLSNIINIPFNEKGFSLNSVYPNPFNDHLSVSVMAEKEELVSIQIFDVNGRLIIQQKSKCAKGNSVLKLKELHSLTAGNYIVRIISKSFSTEVKVIKN